MKGEERRREETKVAPFLCPTVKFSAIDSIEWEEWLSVAPLRAHFPPFAARGDPSLFLQVTATATRIEDRDIMEDTDMASPPSSFRAASRSTAPPPSVTSSQTQLSQPLSQQQQPTEAKQKARSRRVVKDGYIYQPYKDYSYHGHDHEGHKLGTDGEESLSSSKDSNQASATRILELSGLERVKKKAQSDMAPPTLNDDLFMNALSTIGTPLLLLFFLSDKGSPPTSLFFWFIFFFFFRI